MKPIIKPKDHLRKKRHRKPGDLPENVIEQLEKRQHKKEIERTKIKGK